MCGPLFLGTINHQCNHAFIFEKMSSGPSKEAKILMAIDAIRSGQIKSLRNAETISGVSKTTIAARIEGRTSRSEYTPKSKILTLIEEEVLHKYLLDRDDRGFGLNLAGVENMANLLLDLARPHASVHYGLTGSSNENQSSKCDTLAHMTSREPYAKILTP